MMKRKREIYNLCDFIVLRFLILSSDYLLTDRSRVLLSLNLFFVKYFRVKYSIVFLKKKNKFLFAEIYINGEEKKQESNNKIKIKLKMN